MSKVDQDYLKIFNEEDNASNYGVLTDKEFITRVERHIKTLFLFSESINEDKIVYLNELGKKYYPSLKNEDNGKSYWRGADIQVLDDKFWNEKKWNEMNEGNWSADDPLITKFPYLISGLIIEIQEGATYLDGMNKYEFYSCIQQKVNYLNNSQKADDKKNIVKEVILNQILLLQQWRKLDLDDTMIVYNRHKNPTENESSFYFAFGRNVNRDAMNSKNRCPYAELMGPAILDNHRFIIDNRGDNIGYASIEPCPGEKVIGALWNVNKKDFQRLDIREGLKLTPPSYRRERKKIRLLEHPNALIDVETYISNYPKGQYAVNGYIEEIVQGLIYLGFKSRHISNYNKFLIPA